MVVIGNAQQKDRKEYISNMRVQSDMLPQPIMWALQSKPHVVVRDMLLRRDTEAVPMVNATSLAIEAMATGLIVDALNDLMHDVRAKQSQLAAPTQVGVPVCPSPWASAKLTMGAGVWRLSDAPPPTPPGLPGNAAHLY